jgi:hypothetical protein
MRVRIATEGAGKNQQSCIKKMTVGPPGGSANEGGKIGIGKDGNILQPDQSLMISVSIEFEPCTNVLCQSVLQLLISG